jgi:hypothetical protein
MSKRYKPKHSKPSKVNSLWEAKLECLAVVWQVQEDLKVCWAALKECRALTRLPQRPRKTKSSPNHPSHPHHKEQWT